MFWTCDKIRPTRQGTAGEVRGGAYSSEKENQCAVEMLEKIESSTGRLCKHACGMYRSRRELLIAK